MKFWSFEYIDPDGDLITTNFVATREQVEAFMAELAKHGVQAKAYDLSAAAVSSSDAPQLA